MEINDQDELLMPKRHIYSLFSGPTPEKVIDVFLYHATCRLKQVLEKANPVTEDERFQVLFIKGDIYRLPRYSKYEAFRNFFDNYSVSEYFKVWEILWYALIDIEKRYKFRLC